MATTIIRLIENSEIIMRGIIEFLFLIFFFITIGNFIKVYCLERKINALYKEKEERIKKQKESVTSFYIMNGELARIEGEYKQKIEPIERKRGFILDKLPFFKK